MISLQEISIAVSGAWRLAHRDSAGMEYFDKSIVGFWKSFWVAAIVLSGYAILTVDHLGEFEISAGPITILLVQGIGYAIGWVAFPLAMFYAAEAIDRRAHYLGYIVAHNWADVIQVALMLFVMLLEMLNFLPAGLTGLLHFLTVMAILYYEWFIARTALEVSGLVAAAVVSLNIAIGYTLNYLIIGMLV